MHPVPVPCYRCGCEALPPLPGEHILLCPHCSSALVCELGRPSRPLHETDWMVMDSPKRVWLFELIYKAQLEKLAQLNFIA